MGAMAPVWGLNLDPANLKGVSPGLGFPVLWSGRYRAEVCKTSGEGGELRVRNAQGRTILKRTVYVASEISADAAAGWVKQVALFLNDREKPDLHQYERRTKPLSYCS